MIRSTFPRIPHLPGSASTPGDILLDDEGALPFLRERVVVLEKLDGINVTVRRSKGGRIGAALKPEWSRAGGGRVLRAVDIWLRQREERIVSALGRDDTLYGEWLWHQVSVRYDALPELFVGFAWHVEGRGFLPFPATSKRLLAAGVTPNAVLFEGRLGSYDAVRALVHRSRFSRARMEGLFLERVERGAPRWAKWVDARYLPPRTGYVSGERNVVVGRAAPR